MKKIFLLIVLCISFFNIYADDVSHQYRIKVGAFDKVVVENNINVVYSSKKDSVGYINYTSNSNLADAIIATCKDGKLKIQVATDYTEMPGLPTIYIYSDFLNYINNSSDSTFTASSIPPCFKFEAKQVGNGIIDIGQVHCTEVIAKVATGRGNINLKGECETAKIFMIGTGEIQADLLKAKDVECKAIGGGFIGCDPLQTLTVTGLGSTKIYYRGNPTITKKGIAKILPLE